MRKSLILFFISALFFVIGCGQVEDTAEDLADLADSITVTLDEYGLEVDSLESFDGSIQRNQTLADLLLPHQIPYQTITNIANVPEDVFNVRKIRAGNKYRIYRKLDSLSTVKYFIYEKDPVNYVVFDLQDSVFVVKGEKEVTVQENAITGTIYSSLYQTLDELDVSPELALKLADVFAWQINFYGIQAGDYFKVVYEEEYIGNDLIGIGRIKTSLFNHRGENFYAFYYSQGDEVDYFDENGNSLRKAFLKAPLKFSRISSGYSRSRLHPVLKIRRPHLGVDYAAPRGTPVQAIGDGVVMYAKRNGGAGKMVKIKHNENYMSGYLHLSRYGKGIRAGTVVKQGDVIGYVGSTGLSTGPHLDLRFWKNGKLVNYLTMEFPPSKPIDEKHRQEFETVKQLYMDMLNQLELPVEEKQLAAAS